MAALTSRIQHRKLKEAEHTTFNDVETRRLVSVPVVYYLSRNGHLEHPHFMEVTLSSSSHGLFLRDVIARLNLLRGNRIASQYSWSSKRSYKNGFVWQDLEENDFIHPVHGGEYVLKGSEILEPVSSSSPVSKPLETSSSFSTKGTPDYPPPVRNRRRNQSWGGVDLHEYKIYKAESPHELPEAADASTQTDEKRRHRSRTAIKEEIEEEEEVKDNVEQSTELNREEISPPPSDSSPETLESLIKADGRLILSASSETVDQYKTANPTAGYCPTGRMKASSVIMSLISCGSIPFRDCGVVAVKEHGLSLMSQYKTKATRVGNRAVDEEIIMENDDGDDDVMGEIEKNTSNKFAKMALENKEYFSGSLLMETKKDEFSSSTLKLKRSSSCNADRSSNLKMSDEDEGEVMLNCIPRRPKTQRKRNV